MASEAEVSVERADPVLQIHSSCGFHYEIIEAVIVHYRDIIGVDTRCKVRLALGAGHMPQFEEYIRDKYPELEWGGTAAYDYFVGITVYPSDYDWIATLDPRRHFYISHTYCPQWVLPNVFYLTPLAGCNVFNKVLLPYQDASRQTGSTPLFIVQGELSSGKRDLRLLHTILRAPHRSDFRLLLLGRNLRDRSLLAYPQVRWLNNLPWLAFHAWFPRAHALLTLTNKAQHPHYYSTTLTSTIAYARAYGLACVVDAPLQKIYGLEKAFVYDDDDAAVAAFARCMETFFQPQAALPDRAEACDPPEPGRSSLPLPAQVHTPSRSPTPRTRGLPSVS